jgi:glutamate--cysteine ligase
MSQAATDMRPISTTEDAEAYVAMVCFKHGPPERLGVELEWTVHHQNHPDRPLDPKLLADALRDHAPPTVAPDSRHVPLVHGSLVTVEPGGQVEISSPPHTSVGRLLADVESDIAHLDSLLGTSGLCRGESGIDEHRRPDRLLEVSRYAAMQQFLDGRGPWGKAMMCSTASTQVCLDAGQPADVPLRWHTLHSVGPALVALFANSAVVGGRRTGWASNRLRATLGTCPPFTHPVPTGEDPVGPWVDRVLAAPVMCVRRSDSHWAPDRPMSFAAWVGGAGESTPTYDDLDYHLSTLFPPVRPRGYIEVRYLDAQPTQSWHQPVLVLDALLSSREVAERACELTEQCAELWLTAARRGLEDDTLRSAARRLVELAEDHLDPTVPASLARGSLEALHRRTTDLTTRRQPA